MDKPQADARRLAESIEPEVIVAETTTAEEFRIRVLGPACVHVAKRLRAGRSLDGLDGTLALDHGDGPWCEGLAAARGPWALESWRAMVARLRLKLAELERVRLAGRDLA